mmetsp:Transcript_31628/g.100855  ORF Transcript_31628/g.100855 Transcript_31628/m.100855 type:complete len:207 (-) Transcript_31628:261-881(-)
MGRTSSSRAAVPSSSSPSPGCGSSWSMTSSRGPSPPGAWVWASWGWLSRTSSLRSISTAHPPPRCRRRQPRRSWWWCSSCRPSSSASSWVSWGWSLWRVSSSRCTRASRRSPTCSRRPMRSFMLIWWTSGTEPTMRTRRARLPPMKGRGRAGTRTSPSATSRTPMTRRPAGGGIARAAGTCRPSASKRSPQAPRAAWRAPALRRRP